MIVNWELIIPVGMAVLGGVLSHQLAAWRDRANKRREYRVGYLIEVFRSIRKLSQQPQNDVLAAVEELDRLISDIQFLGNEEQIKAAIKLGEEVSKKRTADLSPLMDALRNELRKELGRSRHQGGITRLKASKKADVSLTGKQPPV